MKEKLTSHQSISGIEQAVQSKLDSEAQLAGYDSIHTAVTYADEAANATFQADGQSFRAWRSNVWAYCYEQLAIYQGGGDAPTIKSMLAGVPVR